MPAAEKESDSSGKKSGPSATASSNDVSSTSVSGIENMYKIYEKLNSADDKTSLEPEFRELLSSVHRSEKEKRLASQFITRFMEYFPLHYHNAIDAMLDLCEHDDVSMRRQVVRDLITVCKKVSTFVPKIADVFGQLMQTTDNSEYSSLQSSLISLFHIDGQAALVGMFSQIHQGEHLVKDRCIKFVCTKLKELSPEITSSEFERTLFAEVKGGLKCADRVQFASLLAVLKETKLFRQLNGQQMLADLLAEVLNMEKNFDPTDLEEVHRLDVVLQHAKTIFSSQVSASRFVVYLCTKVIPKLRNKLETDEDSKIYYDILRSTAEIVGELRQIEDRDAKICLESLYAELLDCMPTPASGTTEHPDFQFSKLEILLFLFHKLSQFKGDFLTHNEDRLKDFRNRLQYLARGAQTFMKKLREDLESKKGEALKTEETRIKVTANISALIRDMFHLPPIFKVVVPLSWGPPATTRGGTAMKRPLMRQISGPSPAKTEREREIYQPPGGKFSNRAGTYNALLRGPGTWQPNRGIRNTSSTFRGNRRMIRPNY